jgi:hypothetical protein
MLQPLMRCAADDVARWLCFAKKVGARLVERADSELAARASAAPLRGPVGGIGIK